MQRTSAIPDPKSSTRAAERVRAETARNERIRAVRRKRARRRAPRLLWMIPASLIFLALSAMMAANLAQFRKYQRQADFKAAQLASLSETQSALSRRLTFLQLPKGREQVLLEHGFLKSGQRILLFPTEKAAPNAASDSSASSTGTDDANAPAPNDKDDGGNAWQRTARTLSHWMNQLRGK